MSEESKPISYWLNCNPWILLPYPLPRGSGPTLISYGNGKSNFSEEIEKQKILRIAREECCTICGVHLDGDERNKKLRCTVCYFKKDDRESLDAIHIQETVKNE